MGGKPNRRYNRMRLCRRPSSSIHHRFASRDASHPRCFLEENPSPGPKASSAHCRSCHRQALLVAKAVLGVHIGGNSSSDFARFLHRPFSKTVDQRRRAPVVLGGEKKWPCRRDNFYGPPGFSPPAPAECRLVEHGPPAVSSGKILVAPMMVNPRPPRQKAGEADPWRRFLEKILYGRRVPSAWVASMKIERVHRFCRAGVRLSWYGTTRALCRDIQAPRRNRRPASAKRSHMPLIWS